MTQPDALPDGFKMTELGPLPEEWQVVRLGEVVNKVKGRKPSSTSDAPSRNSLPYLTADYFRTGFAQAFVDAHVAASLPSCTDADVVIIWDGSKAGQVFTGLCGVLASTMVRLDPKIPDLTKPFLYFFLISLFEVFNTTTTGTTIPHVSKTVFDNHPIPLPPLPEQRAIAQVLRTVQEAKEATERVIQAARELKKSLMHHLFTYGPVPLDQADRVPLEETKIGPIPQHWQVVRLGEVADVRGGKRLPKGEAFAEVPTPYPYIRVVDFKNGTVDMSSLKFLTPDQHQALRRYVISAQDVYISIAGTIGLVGCVPRELDGAHLTENAAKLVFKSTQISQPFLVFALASETGQEQIQMRATKTSQPKLALARIKEIPIPLPPLSEQQEIAHILQAVDEKIATEERRMRALEALFQTLLHHLMTGKVRVAPELVEV